MLSVNGMTDLHTHVVSQLLHCEHSLLARGMITRGEKKRMSCSQCLLNQCLIFQCLDMYSVISIAALATAVSKMCIYYVGGLRDCTNITFE